MMTLMTERDPQTVDEVLAHAAAAVGAGGGNLLETEGLAVAEALGLGVPRYAVVADPEEARGLDPSRFPGERVVVKAVSRELVHKSDAGAVRVVAKVPARVAEAVGDLSERLAGVAVEGFGVFEYVPHETGVAGELLLGMRWTEDFGPVVTIGPGGVATELLAGSLAADEGAAILSPILLEHDRPEEVVRSILASRRLLRAVTEPFRGREPALSMEGLAAVVLRFLGAAARLVPEPLDELEFNPVALTPRGAVALDAAGTVAPARSAGLHGRTPEPAPRDPRRHEKIARLLAPESVAILGVSERSVNPGRIILRNMLRRGFPAERLYVVKEGEGAVDGCPRVAGLAALPDGVDRVDLLVLAVAGGQVPGVLDEVVAGRRAESLVVIPGGLGETEGSEERAAALRASLEDSRETPWGGPVVNGGNCLGVRSVPGRVDTLFIPRHKLRFPERDAPDPLALVSQSGAFAIARASKLRTLDPRHLITVGNQLDLTVGDYVEHLVDDEGSRVVACYVEGFRPGDGRRFLRAAAEIVRRGRSVILYRAGRTAAGARASASHTASIAGDFAVSRELARAAGVVVADTLEDFEDLVSLFTRLDGRPCRGRRLGALTNAGFEAVAIADRLGALRLAEYSVETRERIEGILASHRLEEIVTVGNPLDVTPMLGDEGFAEAARAVLDDPGVDLGLISCVPLTGAMETVAPFDAGLAHPGPEHAEDGTRGTGVAARLARLATEVDKPWIAVVDSGSLYDPMTRLLEDAGIPTLRAADRAARLLARWADGRAG